MPPIPLPIIPDVYRLTLRWDGAAISPTPVNVIHIKSTTSGLTTNAGWDAFNASVVAGMWTPLASLAILAHVDVIKLDGTSATATFTTAGGTKWSGGQTGSGVPQVCALIKVQTGQRGRNRRGRVYLPYAAESSIAGGTLDPTQVSTTTTAWNQFQTNLAAATPNAFQFGVASYDRAHNGAGAHFQVASTIGCEGFTATQRRRQPGR